MNPITPMCPCVHADHTHSAILTVLLTARHKAAHLMSNTRGETTALHEVSFSLCKTVSNKALRT